MIRHNFLILSAALDHRAFFNGVVRVDFADYLEFLTRFDGGG